MKATLLLLALLACSTHGARLLLQDPCTDPKAALAPFSDLSDIASLIDGFDMLPGGIPADATIFLPNNAGVAALMGMVQALLPNATVETLPAVVAGSPLGPIIVPKLLSTILYHISPEGAMLPADLAAEGTIVTALGPTYTLDFAAAAAAGAYTVTDLTGAAANVVGEPVEACGSLIYVVDKVLMPAQLTSIPDTTPEELLDKLGGGANATSPAPAPVPAPAA